MPMSDSLFILVTDTHIYQAWSKSLVYSNNQYCMNRYLRYSYPLKHIVHYPIDFIEKITNLILMRHMLLLYAMHMKYF